MQDPHYRGGAYYSGGRPDVVSLIPSGSRRVLDVGCGFGGLGRLLKRSGGCELFGVELNADAAPHLAGLYDEFIIADAEAIRDEFKVDFFDCIIFADVLEHFVDPWATLARYSTFLKSTGWVVASVPNVRNLSLLFKLVARGRWEYRDAGLLDHGHLRFFTRTEIVRLFESAGLQIELMTGNRDRYFFPNSLLTWLPALLVPDLMFSQFLIRAQRTRHK